MSRVLNRGTKVNTRKKKEDKELGFKEDYLNRERKMVAKVMELSSDQRRDILGGHASSLADQSTNHDQRETQMLTIYIWIRDCTQHSTALFNNLRKLS